MSHLRDPANALGKPNTDELLYSWRRKASDRSNKVCQCVHSKWLYLWKGSERLLSLAMFECWKPTGRLSREKETNGNAKLIKYISCISWKWGSVAINHHCLHSLQLPEDNDTFPVILMSNLVTAAYSIALFHLRTYLRIFWDKFEQKFFVCSIRILVFKRIRKMISAAPRSCNCVSIKYDKIKW